MMSQQVIPAENSIEFGAAILISDSQTIARDPLENSIELAAAISDFRFADYRARDPLENSMEIWRGDFDFQF